MQGKTVGSFGSILKILFILGLSGACAGKPAPELGVSALSLTDSNVRPVSMAAPEKVSATGKRWIISTQGSHTTSIAASVLKQGGNLIDAAIAASFAISVERPHSTGIGGGGFLIFHEAKTGRNYVYDFRERAPSGAKPDLFLDENGKVIPDLSVTGAMSVAVPGLVRGLKKVHADRGKLPWSQLLRPAKQLAEKGFEVYPALAHAIEEERGDLMRFKDSKRIFLHKSGLPLKEGETLIQRDLGRTLGLIAMDPEAFYSGKIAKQITKSIQLHQGIMGFKDLKSYSVKIRKAVEAEWKGFHIVSMPPPSSGGIHVIQILKMLEADGLTTAGFMSPEAIHLEASAMQQAFADRAMYLGDPDFTRVPVQGLIVSDYLKDLRAKFALNRARKMQEVGPGRISVEKDHFETTHFSMMDQEGNVVVSTQTINGYFGSKLVAEGTGIVLNNEMDDFSAKIGAKNIFGATSSSLANQVEAGKTPLSSMSPTIVLKNGVPIMALGAPGGTRIITSVAQTILNYLVFHQDLYHSIAAPRIHQQWQPDELMIENQMVPIETQKTLSKLGWRIRRVPAQSNVMAVVREGETLIGVSDPRDAGTSQGE
jgi:gamma-glutamyltranspeptidase/glutathione hydrolase